MQHNGEGNIRSTMEKGRDRNDGPIPPDCETAKERAMEVEMGCIL